MSVNDPLGDMLTRIRNAQMRKKGKVTTPGSRIRANVLDVLKEKPELIDMWLERGQDQRLAGGWGIECEGDSYRIQCYSGDQHLVVKDKARAVAEFVVRYTRLIGDVQARDAEQPH